MNIFMRRKDQNIAAKLAVLRGFSRSRSSFCYIEDLCLLNFELFGSFCSTLRRLLALIFSLLSKHSVVIHCSTLQYFLAKHDPHHCTAQLIKVSLCCDVIAATNVLQFHTHCA